MSTVRLAPRRPGVLWGALPLSSTGPLAAGAQAAEGSAAGRRTDAGAGTPVAAAMASS
ncbi:MAG: hypothetical protein QOG76_7761, partial [Pseudonocardiales bacterium]|nr:hypothetical protein [Pseudonocardiales bacterium]